MVKHIFLTGLRGVGKSTLLQQILQEFSGKVGGFQTLWQNEKLYLMPWGTGGFSPENQVAGRFDHARWRDSKAFDAIAPTLFQEKCDLVVMDEVGFFEGNSPVFQQAILDCLDGEIPVFGVIKPQHTPFLDAIRNHPKVEILWVTEANRESLQKMLKEKFKK